MKILFYDFNIPNLINDQESDGGGASIQANNWINGLLANNIKISVIVEDSVEDLTISQKIEFIKSYKKNKGIPIINWIYYRYPKLKRNIQACKPEYLYQAGAGFLTFVLARICQQLNIAFIHRIANDADVDERIKYRLSPVTRWLYLSALKKTTHILCQNNYQYQQIISKYSNKNILMIHNPITIKNTNQVTIPFNKRMYIAWLGIFQHQKNMMGLLQIVKELPQMVFKIGGTPIHNIDKSTAEAVIELKKCSNVRFEGFIKRSELNEFLGNAYLLLNTSFYEGFSNTFLEAFTVGTPVVAIKKVDPSTIISDYNLGLTCDNHDQLPSLIFEIVTNTQYENISQNCIAYVQDKHDSKKLAKELLDFLDQ